MVEKYYDVPVRNQKIIVKDITRNLKLKRTDNVLELGAGYGRLIKIISKSVNKTVATDIDDMGKFYVNSKTKFIKCEANKLPFKDNEFDKIYINSVCQYFPDEIYAKEVLSELKRVCKVSGLIYIRDIYNKKISLLQYIWRKFVTHKKQKNRSYDTIFFEGSISYPKIIDFFNYKRKKFLYGFTRLNRFNVLIKT